MNEEIFIIKSDLEEINFIGNRETGKWVLGKKLDSEIRENISTPFSKEPCKGVGKIVLNMGRECNFNCTYCLVGDSKQESLKLEGAVGKKVLDRVFEFSEERHIVFHGSEPMMNYGLIQELIEYNQEKNYGISFSIQSNGTLFNKDNLNFLIKNRVGVGVSLDGNAIHQNLNRPYKNNKDSYEDVIKSMLEVKSIQGNISTITVITKENVSDLEEIVESYESLGLESVLFAPVSPITDESLVPDKKLLAKNMKQILDRYIHNEEEGIPTIRIRNLRDYLRIFFRPKTTSNCLQCGSGETQPILAVDCDGSIYPCDFFWGNKEYLIGNISDMPFSEALSSDKNMRVYRDVQEIEPCASFCDWKRFCGGGCPGATASYKNTLIKNSFYCDYNKEMFNYIAKKIPVLHSKKLIRHLIS